MRICDLKQDQCERLIKIASNELYKHDQCCRDTKSHKNVKKDGLDNNSLNFKL